MTDARHPVGATRPSLLEAARHPDRYKNEYDFFHRVYRSYCYWLLLRDVQHVDADSLASEVMSVAEAKLKAGGFERQRLGSFRKWLQSIAHNQLRSHRRATGRESHQALPDELPPDGGQHPADFWCEAEDELAKIKACVEYILLMSEPEQAAFVRPYLESERCDAGNSGYERVAREIGLPADATAVRKYRQWVTRFRRRMEDAFETAEYHQHNWSAP